MPPKPPVPPEVTAAQTLLRTYHDDHRALIDRTLAARGVPASDRPDIVQDVFHAAFRALVKGERPNEPPAWLRRIALRRASNYRRSLGRLPPNASDRDVEELWSAMTDPEQHAEHRELLADFFDEIGEEAQSIVIAREAEGLSWEAVAEQHHLTVERTKYLHGKAIATMDATLKRRTPPGEKRGVPIVPITLDQLFEQSRQPIEITPEVHRRNWEEIQRKIEESGLGQDTETENRSSAPSPAAPLLTFLAGVITGIVACLALFPQRSPALLPTQEPPAPGPALVLGLPAPAIPTPAPPAPAPAQVKPTSGTVSLPSTAELEKEDEPPELAKLEQARAAVEAGEAQRALQILHGCKDGKLVESRQRLWVEACASPDVSATKDCSIAR